MSRSPYASDILAEDIEKIQAWCDKTDIVLILGEVDEDKLRVVRFSGKTERPDDEYLALLERLEVKILVAEVMRLTKERWQQLTGLPDVADGSDRTKIGELLREIEPYIGYVGTLTLYAFLPDAQLVVSHRILAPWSTAIETLRYYEEDIEMEQAEPTEIKATPRHSELARKLATHERYPKARNFEKRCYLANLLFKEEKLSREDIVLIVDEAEKIYDVEIRP